MNHTSTLLDVFEEHAARSPGKQAFVFLGNGADESERLSYATLRERALGVAENLQESGAADAPVLLAYPPGLEFIVALIGCFYAGVAAVPVPFPNARIARGRISAIARECRAGAVSATRAIVGDQLWRSELAGLAWIASDTIGPARAKVPDPPSQGASIALIQYSSGSTAAPKGVMISHANLLHNQRMLASVLGHDAALIGVNWVPAYHDMGLVGAVLQTLFCGGSSVLLPPLRVAQNPILWLRAISRYRGTTSTAPTFAYAHCVRATRSEQRCELDLCSWDVAICGGEPVDATVLRKFAAAFACAGFRRSSFVPAYGLAEATLLATSPRKGKGLRTRLVDPAQLAHGKAVRTKAAEARHLVSCGTPHLGQQVVIVEPQSRRVLPAGAVGEIWLSGSSVAIGYWGQPAATEEVFCARLAEGGDGCYLRTGDLGFIAKEGLFVTGRLKELLIIRGNNFYPQDLEDAVRCAHPSLRQSIAAAFGIAADGEERLVVAVEPTHAEAKSVDAGATAAAAAAIWRDFGLKLHDLAILRPGGLPRTTSGKIQRGRCRELYLTAALPLLGEALGSGRDRRSDVAADAIDDLVARGIAVEPQPE